MEFTPRSVFNWRMQHGAGRSTESYDWEAKESATLEIRRFDAESDVVGRWPDSAVIRTGDRPVGLVITAPPGLAALGPTLTPGSAGSHHESFNNREANS